MRRTIVAIVALALFLALSQGPVAVFAASGPGFELQAGQTALAGGYAEVTVSYTGEKEKVGGLQFYLEYDTAVLAYVAGSRTVSVAGIEDDDLGADANVGNRIHFVWESAKDQGVSVKGDIATYRFKVNPDLSDAVSETAVKLVVCAFYKDDYPVMSDYIYADVTAECKVYVSTNATLNDVLEKIDAIGEVALDEDTRERIEQARTAYDALSPSLREMVTNRDMLFAAEKRYAQLSGESDDAALAQKVSAFRMAHKDVLEKKLDDLVLTDEAAVEAALAAWEVLDLDVRAATISDKRLLNNFVLKLTALKTDAQAWKDAEDMASMLRSKYAGILKLDASISDDLLMANESSINSFVDEIEENAVYVKHLTDVMAEDIAFLGAFLDRLSKMEKPKEENPEALAFKQEFGWLLNYTEEDIVKGDMADLQTALYAYGLLSDEAKAELPGVEVYLTKLYEKAKSLPDEVIKEVVTETEKEIIYVDRETLVEQEPSKFVVRLPGGTLNPLVFWMMGFACFMVVALAVELCIFAAVRRKRKHKEVVGA